MHSNTHTKSLNYLSLKLSRKNLIILLGGTWKCIKLYIFKVQATWNLRFGQNSLLKILRLLGIVYPSFSLGRPEKMSRISKYILDPKQVEGDLLNTLACSPGAFI